MKSKLLHFEINKILLFSLLGILLMCSVGSAVTVDYEVYTPYENSKGIVLTSCDNTSMFYVALQSGAGTFSNGSRSVDGTGSVILSNSDPVKNVYMRTELNNLNMSDMENILINFYIDDYTTLESIKIRLVTYDDLHYWSQTVSGMSPTLYKNGWNTYTVGKSRFIRKGGEATTWDNITSVIIYVTPKSGKTAYVEFDTINYNYDAQPTILFTFDDRYQSVHSLAYQTMKTYGIPGTFYGITSDLDTSEILNYSHLDEMYADGWDISSHTVNHVDLSTADASTRDYELSQSQQDLIRYKKSSLSMSYPYGAYSNGALEAVSQYYLLGRTTDRCVFVSHVQNYSYVEPLSIQHTYVYNDTPTDYIELMINRTIEQNGMLVLTFHNIVDGDAILKYDYPLSNLTNICEYVNECDIQPVTMSSYIRCAIPNGSGKTIIGDTVSAASNGDVTRLTDNNFPGSYSELCVVPSANSVNVTVSTWSNTQKVWTLSSETQQSVTHTIGGFPASTDIQIKRDDVDYETVTSNETGYIEWVYDGGFSEHIFSIECHDFNASLTSGAYPLTTQFTTSSEGIDAYYWDFENDGIIDSTKQNPAHTYGQTGDYSVNLTVHTSEGNVSTVKPDYITVSAPAFASDPVAWFNWVFSYLFGRF
jgi:peptidoglycan/xylan/chitin deacetylase (PgdA/CDA1 family)